MFHCSSGIPSTTSAGFSSVAVISPPSAVNGVSPGTSSVCMGVVPQLGAGIYADEGNGQYAVAAGPN